jgi:type II secretory pathway pseudopilin PulG
MATRQQQAGAGQVIVLVVIAALLAAAYVALDFYTAGEKNVVITESRGTQIVGALSKYKLENGNYPDSLDKLVPKFLSARPRCPGGEAFGYNQSAGEFSLICPNVIFKMKPYGYTSKTHSWQG